MIPPTHCSRCRCPAAAAAVRGACRLAQPPPAPCVRARVEPGPQPRWRAVTKRARGPPPSPSLPRAGGRVEDSLVKRQAGEVPESRVRGSPPAGRDLHWAHSKALAVLDPLRPSRGRGPQYAGRRVGEAERQSHHAPSATSGAHWAASATGSTLALQSGPLVRERTGVGAHGPCPTSERGMAHVWPRNSAVPAPQAQLPPPNPVTGPCTALWERMWAV